MNVQTVCCISKECKKAFRSRKMLNVNKFLPVLCSLVEGILGDVRLMTEADEIRLWKIWQRKWF